MITERPSAVCKDIMSGVAIKQSNKTVAIILSIVLPIVVVSAGWLGSLYGKHDADISANNLKINTLQNQYKSVQEDANEIKEAQKRYSKNQDEMMRALRELLKKNKISTDILSNYDANSIMEQGSFYFQSETFKNSSFYCVDP